MKTRKSSIDVILINSDYLHRRTGSTHVEGYVKVVWHSGLVGLAICLSVLGGVLWRARWWIRREVEDFVMDGLGCIKVVSFGIFELLVGMVRGGVYVC